MQYEQLFKRTEGLPVHSDLLIHKYFLSLYIFWSVRQAGR